MTGGLTIEKYKFAYIVEVSAELLTDDKELAELLGL